MNLFLDNDVLAKLASWDLLEEAIKACGFELSDVRFLPTAPYWLRLAGKNKASCKYPPEVQERMKALLAVGKACEDDPMQQDATLPFVPGIDAGEAILLVQAAGSADSLLTTGDKNCIRAVVSAPAYASIMSRLSGRVLCLEQVLLRAIERLGFDEVKKRVVGSNQLDLDTAVRSAFGSGMQADDKNACWNLERKVKLLAAEAGGMLVAQEYRFLDS